MENYLYFAEADVDTGGGQLTRTGLMVPASSYIGADPVGNTTTKFMFESIEAIDGGKLNITLTHPAQANKRCIRAFMSAMNSHPSTGFVVMADSNTAGASKNSEYNPAFEGDLSTVLIQETKTSNQLAGTAGEGMEGTSPFGGPQTRRWMENGVIVTEIKVDITGLGVKGTAADDVIGLAAGGAAYIYRNVEADNGIVTKMTVECLELPTTGSGTITTDIDMAWNASAVLAYDGAAGTSELNMGTLVKGETFNLLAPALTANDYLYFTEGDVSANDGVFGGGMFVVTLYGRSALLA